MPSVIGYKTPPSATVFWLLVAAFYFLGRTGQKHIFMEGENISYRVEVNIKIRGSTFC